ncbi:hypothetical protein [Novacetimonas pomaceti]|uniref:hypothetical protein n=1 Tax=Novacetimonas pomaceti TaxID=2021998 RepID=UPI001C2D061C|nr:hypothetical protein [Novacetimonas pomaceti]MBV1833565.1 hypothetical protein [Novacetimonas pomaceti]
MGAAFFQKGGVLPKLFEKSFTKNFFVFAGCFVGIFGTAIRASGPMTDSSLARWHHEIMSVRCLALQISDFGWRSAGLSQVGRYDTLFPARHCADMKS